ncbi:MAG TPA: hypothetical protein VKU00_15715 [Chthonomonadaceae bacterium]|nr:hypothetical protein [Chthonomonadaceae bacterium]
MPTKKKQTAIRFKPDTVRILELLAEDTGLTLTGVIELAIRDLAKTRQIFLHPKEPSEESAPRKDDKP